MKFTYKNNEYELAELKEPNSNTTFDIIAVMRIKHCIWDAEKEDFIEVDKETYDATEDHMIKYDFTTYFYGAYDDEETLIENAKGMIDFKEEN